MKTSVIVIQAFFVVAMLIFTSTAFSADKIDSKVIIDGGWGKSTSQFGRDYSGKTEDEFELDLCISNDKLYILDSMNNRIQVFNNDGNYSRDILLNTAWNKVGLYFYFSIYRSNIYILSGKPPYYSDNSIIDIQKYSLDGKHISSIGNKYLSKTEGFDHLFSDSKSGHLFVAVNGGRVLAIDEKDKLVGPIIKANKDEVVNLVGISSNGNPIVTVSKSAGEIVRTVVIDKESHRIIQTVSGRYSLTDDKGNFYSVRTLSASKRKKKPMSTKIEVFHSVTNKKEVFELTGDIVTSKNGKEKVYRLAGNYFEASRIDANGAIYHLLALDDGVVVRKITLK